MLPSSVEMPMTVLTTPIAHSETFDSTTKILVVIGANGAGKSSFGRDLLERYAGQAKRISGIHALFISDDESKLSASNEFARLQSMIKERLFMPRISEYEKLILQLQSEEFEAAVNFKEASKTNNKVDPPITKIDIIQAIWEKMFPHNRLIRKSGFIELVSTGRDSNSYTAGRMSDSEKLVFYLIGAALCALHVISQANRQTDKKPVLPIR